MRELLGWVLIFLVLAVGPAAVIWLSLFSKRRTVWLLSAYEREPRSTLEGDSPLPPPPRTPVFSPLKTTGIRRRRAVFASQPPPPDGFMPATSWLDHPSAPELPTEIHPETPPGAPDESWSGRGGSFGGAGASGFYGSAEGPSAPSTCDAAASSDTARSCGGSGGVDGSD